MADVWKRARRAGVLPRHGWAIALAFVAVVVAFGASTLNADRQLNGFVYRMPAIARDTVPRITHLSPRSRLRDLDHGLDGALPGYASSRRAIEATITSIDRDLAAFAGAWAQEGNVSEPLERTRELAGKMREVLPARRLADVASSERASVVSHAATARGRAPLYGIALDAASVVLAVIVAVFAFRAVRRHDRALERRAAELDRFAQRVAQEIETPLTPAVLALERAVRELPEDAPLHRASERGLLALERVRTIIDDLLDCARRGATGHDRGAEPA